MRSVRPGKSRRKSKIIVVSLFVAFFAFVTGLFLWPVSSEILVVSRNISVREGEGVADTFAYSAPAISSDMVTGCNVPAFFKLYVVSLRSRGRLRIYINDVYVGYADVTSSGQVAITSGCGCGTSCICTIQTGQNTVRFVSEGFSGEVKYEIYVKR